MSKKHLSVTHWLLSAIVLLALLAGCAAPAATPAAQEQPPAAPPATAVPQAAPTEVPPTQAPAPTEAAATQPEATTAPAAASTLDLSADPATLDANYSPDIPDPTSPVTVTFASWVHGEADYWENMAARFHELHPNITIEFQDIPAEEMADKLTTQIAANNPPDAAYVDSSTAADFGTRNALVPLDDYIAKSKVIDLTDYVPAFLNAAQANGKQFGLPIDGETTGLFYRTDRFEEAGLDPNKPPTTWDEFKADAEKLTDAANKKYGTIVFATEAAYYFYPWLWQAGGDTLDKDGQPIWDSPEGQLAADFYTGLAKYSPADFLSSNSWDGRVAFANGDVAMYVAGAWFGGTLMTEFPDATGKWNTAPLPTYQNNKCATTVASDDLVVFSASKNQDAAFKWIEFVSAPQNMAMLNLGTPDAPSTLLPPRNSLLDNPAIFVNRPFLKGFADNMKCAVTSDVVQPRYGEMEQFLNDALGAAMYGQMTGAEAVKKSAQEARDLLKQ